MKFLLVDDSKILLKKIARSLTEMGFEVVGEAFDGIEGFEKYKQLKPDVVLLDVTMPNRDGRECLIDIMKFDSEAKIIMLSALKSKETIEDCKAIGAKYFIFKDDLMQQSNFSDVLGKALEEIRVRSSKA